MPGLPYRIIPTAENRDISRNECRFLLSEWREEILKNFVKSIAIALVITIIITGVGSYINYSSYQKSGELKWSSETVIGSEGTLKGFGGWEIPYDRSGNTGDIRFSSVKLISDAATVFAVSLMVIAIIYMTNNRPGRDREVYTGGKGSMRMGRGDVRNLLKK